MKLISKQEPVQPVAPYVWGAKYLVLDSVPEVSSLKGGETVVATVEDSDGSFIVNTETSWQWWSISPQHLQLIDPAPQTEHVPVTVDSAVIGKQYLLIADGHDVSKGEIVTLAEIDDDENIPCYQRAR